MSTTRNGLLVVVQARYESERFPGKVVAPLLGQPMILWQLLRLQQLRAPHTLVVACPETEGTRQHLMPLLTRHGYTVEVVEGDPADVLTRFAVVAERYEAEEVVRLTGDCPLIDPAVVDGLIAYHHWRTSPRPHHTGIGPYWPDGCDCEIFHRGALAAAATEAILPREREHVTPFLYDRPGRFRCAQLPCPLNLVDVQWSVDTRYDLTVATQILRHTLARVGFTFTWQDLWLTLELRPDLRAQMLARPARNSAYVAAVEAETGVNGRTWEYLRYQERLDG